MMNIIETLRFKDAEHMTNFIESYKEATKEEVKLVRF